MRSRVRASHWQTRQPVTADWKVSYPTQESAGASTAEEGQARQFTASELQADLQQRLHYWRSWDGVFTVS